MNIIRLATAKLKLLNMCTSMIGRFLAPLPEHQRNQADRRDGRQRDDEVRAEPVVFLALVEQDLKGADAQSQQRDADVVDADAGARRRAARYGGSSTMRNTRNSVSTPTGKIDVEDPAPGVIVGDPAAERGADGRRHDRGDAVQRKGQAALLRREGVGQNRLRHRLQSAAARALQDAEHDQRPQRRRGAAKQRAEREQEDAQQEEALSPEQRSPAIR